MLRELKDIILSKIKGQPYKISLILTEKCNSRCINCNNWKKKVNKDELKVNEIGEIFKKLPKNIFWLSITGGEPTLRRDLFEVIKTAKESHPSLKMVGIATNGIKTKEIVQLIRKLSCLEGIRYFITISLDGSEKVHDKIRGVKGAYKKAVDTYDKLQRLGLPRNQFKFLLETVVSKTNISYLADAFSKGLFKSCINRGETVIVPFHNGFLYDNNGMKGEINSEDIDKFKEIIGKVIHGRRFSFENVIQTKYLKTCMSFMQKGKVSINCKALTDSFALTSNGKVIPCLMWGRELGNLREYEYDINKIMKSRKFRKCKRVIWGEGCQKCWTPCEAYPAIISSFTGLLNNRKL